MMITVLNSLLEDVKDTLLTCPPEKVATRQGEAQAYMELLKAFQHINLPKGD